MTGNRVKMVLCLAALASAGPAAGQGQALLIDATAADPLAHIAQHLGGKPEALERAFPSRRGAALAPSCAARINARASHGEIYTIDMAIKGPGCFDLGMQALQRAYGKPNAEGGYGYATTLGNALTRTSVMVLKWCPAGHDVLVVQPAAWRDGINITVARPGSWNPRTGKRVDPASLEQCA